jgi:tetratricopeptide (TPR) repeat protein
MVAHVCAHSRDSGNSAGRRQAQPQIWRKRIHRGPRFLRLLLTLAVGLAAPGTARADQLRADLTAEASGGFARLVFSFSDDVDATARVAGGVLIVSFGKPVDVAVDRLAMQVPDYVAAARRDPDGGAVRVALTRKVTVNTLTANDKLFVDLLPETWSGAPPGLPQDVLEELARRAKEAERLERLAHRDDDKKKLVPVRVRVATQPTFTRYVFDIPDQTAVSADRAGDRLTLTFDTPMVFDLADALAALPPAIGAISTEAGQDTATVRFAFATKPDVRTFRDSKNYVVDVVSVDADAAAAVRDRVPTIALPDVASGGGLEVGPGAGGAPATIAAQAEPPVAARASERKVGENKSAENKPAENKSSPVTPAEPSPAAGAQQTPTAPMQMPKAAQVMPAEPVRAPAAPAASEPAKSAEEKPPAEPLGDPAKVDPAKVDPTKADQAKADPAKPDSTKPGAVQPTPTQRPLVPTGKSDIVSVDLVRDGANLKLSFPFLTATAAAVFHRADTLWIVFDSPASFDLSALEGEASRTIRAATFSREGDVAIVRLRLDRPHLSSISIDGPAWTVTVGDAIGDRRHALDITRNMIGPNRASISIPFEEPHRLHRVHDSEVGDDLLVVTGFGPVRGFTAEQDFIEFHVLATTQGVVIEPMADDLNVSLAADKIVAGRPAGLTLSSVLQRTATNSALNPLMFDAQVWGMDRASDYRERQSELLATAAAAPPNKRLPQRMDLARFYIACDMYPEAKGVLDVALAEEHPAAEDVSATVMRAIAEVMMNRPHDALKDLANPAIGDQHDAPLWRALAYAGEGRWGRARDSFKSVEAAIATLPIELQRVALRDEMRAAIEVGDFAGAADVLNDLETIGASHELQPQLSVLIGRLSEGMGHAEQALSAYRSAADSPDRPAAAQGQLRELALRYALGDLKREDAVNELETLTTLWRGDETEAQALEILARLYTEQGRYRESFNVMRAAAVAHPDSDITRRIQEQAAKTFDMLFLDGKADATPPIDALALFYDFRELTPIGRRGDEMIRRLTDRLVAVDLLDQATELLQYQVDHRLQGAARAQVATRLAVIYLMNRKADRALATLRGTRTADVSNELRNQRLLLEARALSDLGRYDLALEVVANVEGRQAVRLRADILWAARRWTKAAEQIELYYGERWKDWQPLSDIERSDVLRAAVGYALGEDALGLSRFREKYAAKMAQTPDGRAFQIVSAPLGTSGAAFRDIARAAASVDTLDAFMRDMQARYPDTNVISPAVAAPSPAAAAPGTTGAISAAGPSPKAPSIKPPATRPAALPPAPAPPRAAGRTALR